jgi:putative heme-binding domain-containing protein
MPNCSKALCSILIVFLGVLASVTTAAEADYSVVDPELMVVKIDSDPKESFLGMQLDSAGRLFVGGREALFVYEPKPEGGYQLRKELYRFPKDTWIYDIAIRGNDLYVLTVSALYLIPDAVVKREELKPKRLVWGIPLAHPHQGFHGLAIGPEGDIYFANGDPLVSYGDFSRPDHWAHWTFFIQPEGTQVPYTGDGGVNRIKPDGTFFQAIARGTRNSVGLAFDAEWNLFSNDNDHESLPSEYVPGRLLHVTPKAYFSWPRGWLVEKHPERADLLETLNPNLGRYVPVGQAYYNDTFLPEKYRNNLLVARWDRREVPRYPLVHHGATFKADELPLFVGRNDARPVSVTVGRGGRIFVTVSYMEHNDSSPIYKSDLVMITRADDSPAMPFDAYDSTQAAPEKLWAELSDPSWTRRYRAHIEIQRRGGAFLEEATKRLVSVKPGNPASTHLVWLAGASRSLKAALPIAKLEKQPDENLRVQALRAMTEYFGTPPPPEALKDQNLQFQLAAVLAQFNQPGPVPDSIITGPALSKDTYIRQAAAFLLAQRATIPQIGDMCQSTNPATRLAGVLAAGFRITVPAVHGRIRDEHTLDQSHANEYVIPFEDGSVDLRKFGRIGNFTIAEHWNQGNGTPEEERMFDHLMSCLNDSDQQVRLEAAFFLRLLNDKRSEPLIEKVLEQNAEQRLAVSGKMRKISKVWLAGPFPDGTNFFSVIHPPEAGAIDLLSKMTVADRSISWQRATNDGRMFDLTGKYGPCDHSSWYAHFRLESGSAQPAMLLIGSDDGVKVWQNGRVKFENAVVRAALPFQDVVMLKLEPGGNDVLIRVHNDTGICALYLDCRTLGNVEVTLPDALSSMPLAERARLGVAPADSVPTEFLMFDWAKEVAKGDADSGRKLFNALACVKCHGIKPGEPGGGAPSLADARLRFSVPYLVESILLPNKVVSPIFRWTAIRLLDGDDVNGLVVGETAAKLELLMPDATRKSIEKSAIKSRQIQDRSPMPDGLVKNPNELRDLLAYILSENP